MSATIESSWENERLKEEIESLREQLAKFKSMSATEACAEIPAIGEYVAQVEKQLEIERHRLAICGFVAMANTPESAASVRDMLPKYRSAACDDVARIVDSEMALRQQLADARLTAEYWKANHLAGNEQLAQAEINFGLEQDDKERALDQLANREKQIVMARQRFSEIAWSNDSKWQSDAAVQALAATADLDGYILCEKEPVAYMEKTHSGDWFLAYSRNDMSPQRPLYRAARRPE